MLSKFIGTADIHCTVSFSYLDGESDDIKLGSWALKSSTQCKRHPGNEAVALWSPVLSRREPGALLLSGEYLTLRYALPGVVLGLLGRIPFPVLISSALGWAKTQHDERPAVCKRDRSTRLQSTAPTWLCRNEVFLFSTIGASEMFSSIFQKENSAF